MTVLSAERRPSAPVRRDLPSSMVERMTLILDAFAGPRARLTLEDVSRATHLPRSTAHRILDQLVRLNWLDHSSFGYSLGARALGFGCEDGAHAAIREAAASILHSLQLRTGMVVQLAVLDGPDVFYLDKAGGHFALSVPSRVGGRAPAHATALGKSMLAWMEPERVETLTGRRLQQLTSTTIADIGMLYQELWQIRQRRGVAFERGECFPGIACVAAAAVGPEGPLASISLAGDTSAALEPVAPLVVRAAREVSLALCCEPRAPRPSLRTISAGDEEGRMRASR
ncbi:MAG TPA: IclR family transcriptional regulator [Streptosporangiaceae bacterium]